MVAKLKEMKYPGESIESVTLQLNAFIPFSVYMTIDLGTFSVVASSSCLVELSLAIFWAVFRGFSCFFAVAMVDCIPLTSLDIYDN